MRAKHSSVINYDEFSNVIGHSLTSKSSFLQPVNIRFQNVRRQANRIFDILRRMMANYTSLAKFQVNLDGQSAASEDYIRWINQVTIGKKTLPALFMHPESSQNFRFIKVPRKAKLSVNIALMPEVWDKNIGGVTFIVSILIKGEHVLRREWSVNPSQNKADRCWRKVSIPLSSFNGNEIEVKLETKLSPAAQPVYAWAVWGNPLFIESKSILVVVKNQLSYARKYGFRKVLSNWYRKFNGSVLSNHEYQIWLRREDEYKESGRRSNQQEGPFTYQPLISILTPTYNTDPLWLRKCVESVLKQSYSNWELYLSDDGSSNPNTLSCLQHMSILDPRIHLIRSENNQGISAATNIALKMCSGEYVGLVDHDDEIAQNALFEIVRLLNLHSDADLIYTDEDKINIEGERFEPFFKPEWSPEYLLSTMYIGHLTVYRRSIVESVGGFRSEYDGSQDYDLALRVSKCTNRIFHIPLVLYHWRTTPLSTSNDVSAKPWAFNAARRALVDHVSQLNIKASVVDQADPGYYRVRYSIIGDPLVTIVIPTAGRIVQTPTGSRDLVKLLLRSIVERTTFKNYEIVVVDNGQLSEDAEKLIKLYDVTRITYEYAEPFNFSSKLNFAVSHARGEHIVLLNDDIEIISPDWLTAMLEFSQQSDIGAVGARLLFPNGTLQHIGVVLGIGGGACHVFSGQPNNHPGYFNSSQIIRNYSAVTGACMMTRREIFTQVGGFDDRFPTDFNDVDFCLKIRAKGYRIVSTPFAELFHYEGATFGSRERVVNPAEISLLKERWQSVIDHDPYYNLNLSRSSLDYRINI